MSPLPLMLAAVVGAASLVAGSAPAGRSADPECTRGISPEYAKRVATALRSNRDVWGERLVAAPSGPSYAAAARIVSPLVLARAPQGQSLTRSGVHYLALSIPPDARGGGGVMLHVADGSEILVHRATGPSLPIRVGPDGREGYGSCATRLTSSRLAEGWLPILQTRYRDDAGNTYAQESFAARVDGELRSFVRLTVTARTRATLRIGVLAATVGGGETLALHARWRSGAPPAKVDATTYAAARASVEGYWRSRLAEGARLEVPERRVQDAYRALLVQGLSMTWRYSVGNAYEQFSFPETTDVAQVLAEHGFRDVARAVLVAALPARPTPYPNWKRGEKLLGYGRYYELTRDRAALDAATPTLRGFLTALEGQLGSNGLLPPERFSSDIPDQVRGLHAQARIWQGLRAIAEAWRGIGRNSLATRAGRLADRLGAGLRRAVKRSQRQLADDSVFLPMRLLAGVDPYGSVTASRAGSYWNLVAPYALASGLFPPTGEQAQGAWRYLQLHGARLLGLVRTAAPVLYGPDAGRERSGVNPVYGNSLSRFLAALDEPDQLALGLYGQLAVGMTRGTVVGGEGTTVAPLAGRFERTTYLPPNAAANASFLATLRLALVHDGADGLELAFATPRSWLAAGKRIAVEGAPTRFGPVSYLIDARPRSLRVRVRLPSRPAPQRVHLRLRLPAGERIGRVTPSRPVDSRTQTIDLSGLRGTVELEVARLG